MYILRYVIKPRKIMFTNKDISHRTIYIINCIEKRTLRVSNGELLLHDNQADKTLTKLPFQKILALFVVGHISITTALIDKCKKFNVALVVMKLNLRPIFFWSNTSEGNYLLRQKQHQMLKNDISIARVLVSNKVQNQYKLLCKIRQKSESINKAKTICTEALELVNKVSSSNDLMGIEGIVAKYFFAAYYESIGWQQRLPRTRIDAINATLDIGYTILFNFIEVFIRMFGFDLYIGVHHKLWFRRKSLVCDLMEPFRCIVDAQVRKSFNYGQFTAKDFNIFKGEYILKREMNSHYQQIFYNALISHKNDIFIYIQRYYRCFMNRKSQPNFPNFIY